MLQNILEAGADSGFYRVLLKLLGRLQLLAVRGTLYWPICTKGLQVWDLGTAKLCSYSSLLAGPLLPPVLKKLGCRVVGFIGSFLMTVSFSISFFAPNIAFLFFSMGVVGGEYLSIDSFKHQT